MLMLFLLREANSFTITLSWLKSVKAIKCYQFLANGPAKLMLCDQIQIASLGSARRKSLIITPIIKLAPKTELTTHPIYLKWAA